MDVLSCYFPVAFTPPPNNIHGITREMLAAALEKALAASAQLAPLAIPVLLEKVESTHRQAIALARVRSRVCQRRVVGVSGVEHLA